MGDRGELFVRWELGLADVADEAALTEALRDPLARREFARQARIAVALGAARATPARQPRRRLVVRRPASTVRWAVAAGLIVLVGLVALLTVPPPTAPFAHLETAAGVRVRALVPGETVETTADPAVLVLGSNTARVELAAGTRLRLPESSELTASPVRLELPAGTVRATVAPRSPEAPFSIAAPHATATVVGTAFTFSALVEGAALAVDDGAVRLSTATDAGILVPAGRSAVAAEGLASMTPVTASAPRPLPAGSRVLTNFAPDDAQGWRGAIDAAAGAWRSALAQPGDPWSDAELRSPVARAGWTVEPGTWMRFRYHVERFRLGSVLEVHLKPEDESNYAWRLVPEAGDGWHEAEVRVDGGFRHLLHGDAPLAAGERIHGVVWCALRGAGGTPGPVRFWIRDAVVFTVPP